MNNVCLLIFARQPLPGRVKTRMTPSLSAEEAAAIYREMLLDILDSCRRLSDVDIIIFYDDYPGSREFFLSLSTKEALFPQKGNGLGKRMANAFTLAFSRGYRGAVIIGTDSPDLPSRYIEEASALLNNGRSEVVFGPTDDGGYYLLGLTACQPALFRDIPWSTERVLAASLAKCREAGLRAELLPPWYDLDTVHDLARINLARSAADAPRTCRAIAGLRDAGRI